MTAKKYKCLKFTVSGSYRGKNNEVFDFDGIDVTVPFNDRDIAFMHIMRRQVPMAIRKDKKNFPDRLNSIREVFVDDVKEVEATLSFVGKDIRDMTAEELQDLALAKDLRSIPLPYNGSIRRAREEGCISYSNKFLGKNYDKRDPKAPSFDYASTAVVVKDADCLRDDAQKFTNDEIIELEQKNNSTKAQPAFSLNELKQIARGKSIAFNDNVSYDSLYDMIFNG